MEDAGAAFRQALIDGDVATMRGLLTKAFPHLSRLSQGQAEIVMHRARTETQSMPMRVRAYSHRWLSERMLPSGLPDYLRPRAERIYPVIADAVGIAVKASRRGREEALVIRQAMSDAVMECYADGVKDVLIIRSRMAEARRRVGG